MAKSKKKDNTNTLLILGGAALVGWALLGNNSNNNNNSNSGGYSNYPSVPPPPPQNTPEWTYWVTAITGTFGNVIQLWQPGGPFYNEPGVIDVVGQPSADGGGGNNSGIPCWDDPYQVGC